MLRFASRAAMAAPRTRSAAPVCASRAAPRVNPPPFRSALALTPVMPAHLLRWLSPGGRARPPGVAAGLGAGGGQGGVSRGLAGSRGGSTGGGGRGSNSPDGRQGGWRKGSVDSKRNRPRELTDRIEQCGDARELQEIVEEHGESFNDIHVTASWVALRKMRSVRGLRKEEALLQQLQDVTRQTVKMMRARPVSNVVHTMAKLHASRRMVVDDALAGELLNRAKNTAGSFTSRDITNLVWAVVTMGIKPDAGLLEAMQERAIATAEDFNHKDVANFLWALAKMDAKLDAGLLEVMQERAFATVVGFKPHEIANLVWALATMGVEPDSDMLEVMQERAMATAGGFSPQNVAKFVEALATMGVEPDPGLVAAMEGRAAATAGELMSHLSKRSTGSPSV